MPRNSIAYNRHTRILDLLSAKGAVHVQELSESLGVSPVTIRRDLDFLNDKGYLARTHGGATLAASLVEAPREERFVEKDVVNVVEKKRIAEKAAELIKDDEILFMNSGSTVLFFLAALRKKRLRVITNNAAALRCDHDPLVELVILGGLYREQSQSFVGEFALNAIHNIYSTTTILGTNGINIERGLTTSVSQECSINQSMIENTHGSVIVLADYSKMDKISNFVSSPLSTVNVVVTDSRCPEDYRKRLQDAGVRVVVA